MRHMQRRLSALERRATKALPTWVTVATEAEAAPYLHMGIKVYVQCGPDDWDIEHEADTETTYRDGEGSGAHAGVPILPTERRS